MKLVTDDAGRMPAGGTGCDRRQGSADAIPRLDSREHAFYQAAGRRKNSEHRNVSA